MDLTWMCCLCFCSHLYQRSKLWNRKDMCSLKLSIKKKKHQGKVKACWKARLKFQNISDNLKNTLKNVKNQLRKKKEQQVGTRKPLRKYRNLENIRKKETIKTIIGWNRCSGKRKPKQGRTLHFGKQKIHQNIRYSEAKVVIHQISQYQKWGTLLKWGGVKF